MIQLGMSVVEIEALRIFNQALLFSVLGVHVFYLLLLDRELPFKKRVLTGLKKDCSSVSDNYCCDNSLYGAYDVWVSAPRYTRLNHLRLSRFICSDDRF